MRLRTLIKRALRGAGIDVSRVRPPHFGESLRLDLPLLLPGVSSPVVFDVGANEGQSVETFRAIFPGALVHSFEPSPSAFRVLDAAWGSAEGVRLWNVAVGAEAGRMTLNEYELSLLSSRLELRRDEWGETVRRTPVDVITLDAFLGAEGLERVDLLKTDTQGCDLDVFQGAARALKAGRIRLVLCEVTFLQAYDGGDRPDQVYRCLSDYGFAFVGCYGWHRRHRLADWTDALFVHREYLEAHLSAGD